MATLITGGTGLAGSGLARYLVQNKKEKGVVIFDIRPNFPQIADIQDQVNVVQGDIGELTELLEVFQKYDVDRVVHLAYLINADATPARSISTNVVGTSNVFEAARLQKVKRVAYASSAAVHPPRKTPIVEPVNEDVMPRTNTLYGAAKLFNEFQAELFWKNYGLESLGFRFPAVFGWGRTSRGGPSPGWSDAPGLAFIGKPIVQPPDDQNVDWVYTVDLAEALWHALHADMPPHHVFNINASIITVGEWTNAVRKLVPEANITVSSEPVSIAQVMNADRIRDELDFRPKYNHESAIAEYIDGVRSGKFKP